MLNNISERLTIISLLAFYLSLLGLQILNIVKYFLKTDPLSEGFVGYLMRSRYPKGIMIATSALLIILGLSYIMMNFLVFRADPDKRKSSLVTSLVLGTAMCLVPAGLIINDLISHSDKSLMLMNYGLLALPAMVVIVVLGAGLYFMSVGLNKFFDNFAKYNAKLSDKANEGGIKGSAYTLLKLPFYLLTAVLGVLSVPFIAVEFCIKLIKAVVDLTIYICKGIVSLVSGKDEVKKGTLQEKETDYTNTSDGPPSYGDVTNLKSDESPPESPPSYEQAMKYLGSNFTFSSLLQSFEKTIEDTGKSFVLRQ